jgi:hypothetical protein
MCQWPSPDRSESTPNLDVGVAGFAGAEANVEADDNFVLD